MKYLVWVPCFVLHHHSFKYESLLLKWVRFVELYAGKCNYHNIVSEFTTAMETVCDLSFFLAKPRLCVFIIGFCLYNWSDFLRDGDCKVLVKRCRILLLLVSIFFCWISQVLVGTHEISTVLIHSLMNLIVIACSFHLHCCRWRRGKVNVLLITFVYKETHFCCLWLFSIVQRVWCLWTLVWTSLNVYLN